MLETMRRLAVLHLYTDLDGEGDPEAWFRTVHATERGLLLPYLTEVARESMSHAYYVLSADPHDAEVAVLEGREFVADRDQARLPFVKPAGSQSGAVGPVLKRTYAGGPGPSTKILKTTIDGFEARAAGTEAWAAYFAECAALCRRPHLRFGGQTMIGTTETPALMQAIQGIPEKSTCFVAVADAHGRLPGERPDYLAYLLDALATTKYTTGTSPARSGRCSLTGVEETVYANALKGAGLNLTNVDRVGVFSALSVSNAAKRFALSLAAADALYAFYYHYRLVYLARVAGARALLLPTLHSALPLVQQRQFMRAYRAYVEALDRNSEGVENREDRLRYLAEQGEAISSVTIVWATFGQNMDDVAGMVQDIMPSRLSVLSQALAAVQERASPFFPEHPVGQLDLGLNHAAQVMKGPRGWRGSDSRRLAVLSRDLAAAAYHARPIPRAVVLNECMAVARGYLSAAARDTKQLSFGCLNEDKNARDLTLAGWLKHLTRLLYWFATIEGETMSANTTEYTPTHAALAPYFADGAQVAGLDSDAKRWCFVLGALFGHLLQVQNLRGVNTGKALGWLKSGSLSARDLPALFSKVYEKLLEYRNDTDERVRRMARGYVTSVLTEESGALGVRLGTAAALTQDEVTYFVLLGIANSRAVAAAIRATLGTPSDEAEAEAATSAEHE